MAQTNHEYNLSSSSSANPQPKEATKRVTISATLNKFEETLRDNKSDQKFDKNEGPRSQGSSTDTYNTGRGSDHFYMLQRSKVAIETLKEANNLAEQSLNESMALNQSLIEETNLIDHLKRIRNRQSELHSHNVKISSDNQTEMLKLQYFELSKVDKAPDSFEVPIPQRPRASPPPIQEALSKRPPTPGKAKRDIERQLDEAEKRREIALKAKLESLKQRPLKFQANLERLQHEAEEALMERKRKEYLAHQRLEMQRAKLLKDREESQSKRRVEAEKLKNEYEQKENVWRAKNFQYDGVSIAERHQLQKAYWEKRNEERKAEVQKKIAGEKKLSVALTQVAAQPKSPVKALKEAKLRRDHPERFTPKQKQKSCDMPQSTYQELTLHSKIVAHLEQLMTHTPSEEERRKIEQDLLLEREAHDGLMERLVHQEKAADKEKDGRTDEKSVLRDSSLPPIPKLEFKIDEENIHKKRRNKKQQDEELRQTLEKSPFKGNPKVKHRNARKVIPKQQIVQKDADTDGGPSPAKKKHRV